MRILKYTHTGEESDVGYILRKTLFVSSALVKKLKYAQAIMLNGECVKTIDKIKSGDVLELAFPYVRSDIEPVEKNFTILYEDEDIICLCKERGVPSHPSINHHGDTLANYALFYLEKTKDEFHIVTRLDSLTSGIVLAAKNQYSASVMCTREYNRMIRKKYSGICRGIFENKQGVVEAPISRSTESIIKRCVSPDGKYSKTAYNVIDERGGNSLVDFELHTGRTHQIRVHMSHISHPLLNDFLYDENAIDNEKICLHCREITFEHPFNKNMITVRSDLPSYFDL